MNTNDYVKYLTQQFVRYIDVPKEERKKRRITKKESKENFSSHWFGIIPFALKMAFKKKQPNSDR